MTTIRDLLSIANTKKEYLMEDAKLTELTKGMFKDIFLIFIDENGNEYYDKGFKHKKIAGVRAVIFDKEMVHTIPNVTLDTRVAELFAYTYDWYGLDRKVGK